MKKERSGISLIMLMIIIAVSLILLAAVVLNIRKGDTVEASSELQFKSNIRTYQTELEDYISDKEVENGGRYNSTLYATEKIVKHDGAVISNQTIKDIIPSMTDSDVAKYYIYNSKLLYIGTDVKEQMWSSDIVEVKDIDTTSYESRGLVLNLDGYNALSEGYWKSYATETPIKLGNFQNYTYDDVKKCYTFNEGSAKAVDITSISQNYTIEILLSTSKYADMSLGFKKDANTALRLRLKSEINYPCWDNGSSVNFGQEYTIKQSLNKISSFVLSNNSNQNEANMYFNGQKFPVSLDNVTLDSMFYIGDTDVFEKFSGDVYAIRVYNRGITEQEVKSNYELDKIRFGVN